MRYRVAEQRLSRLLANGGVPRGSRVGIEKESLRVGPQGAIARSPHPRAIGSALTHPYITTDYSEALLELITPPFEDPVDTLDFLRDLQKFVYDRVGDEVLWANSMPCVLAGPESIPIADYGPSNVGMMKTVYRRGLGHRYGRMMQVIAGVHFNYSMPDTFWPIFQALEKDAGDARVFVDRAYFGMIRNLQRFGWLVPYLFGASPAICKTFLAGQPTPLQEFDATTYYEPYGTSLRMGDIGYQNKQEHDCGIRILYDNVNAYVDSLTKAIETPCKKYRHIGVVENGEYRQLNTNLLQIENEYYSTIRPKQVLEGLEKPTLALRRRGVRYVELRSLDLDVFDPLGIDLNQVHFLEVFMLFCLLQESPLISEDEAKEIDANQSLAAHRGRDPELELQRDGKPIRLRDWALELFDAMQGMGEVLDQAYGGTVYARTLQRQLAVVHDAELTPSARMLKEMRDNGEGFFQFSMRKSREHLDYFNNLRLTAERERQFEDSVAESHARQAAIEAADDVGFNEFLDRYFAQR